MQTFATIFLSLSLALASASASPIESRAGTILCSADPVYTRPVSINVRFVDTGYREVFYGLNSGSNVLVGTAANGTGESILAENAFRAVSKSKSFSRLTLASSLLFFLSVFFLFRFFALPIT